MRNRKQSPGCSVHLGASVSFGANPFFPGALARVSTTSGMMGSSISFQQKVYGLFGAQRLELFPSMNDRIGVDFRDPFQNSVAEFLPGLHPDVP